MRFGTRQQLAKLNLANKFPSYTFSATASDHGVLLDQELTFAPHAHRLIRDCYYQLRLFPHCWAIDHGQCCNYSSPRRHYFAARLLLLSSLYWSAGVAASTDSRQLLDSRIHGDCSYHVLYSTSYPGRT